MKKINIIKAIKKAVEDDWMFMGEDKENNDSYRVAFNGKEIIISKNGIQLRIDSNKIDFQPYYKGKE